MMIEKMEDFLKNKVALVTGASSGIGLEACIQLLEKGVRLYMVGRDLTILKARISECQFEDDQLHFIQADLANDSDIMNIVNELEKEDGIDFLIHSAGIIFLGPFETESIDNFDKQYRVNLRAPFLITQKLLPKVKNNKGQIVFINSTAGLSAWENHSQYSATKFGLRAVADSLRVEVAPFGVKVISIFPGSTDTPMQEQVQQLEGNPYNPNKFLTSSEVVHSILCSISLPRNSIITEVTIRPNKY